MGNISLYLSGAILMVMTYQDLKYRAITWWLFPIMLLAPVLNQHDFNIITCLTNLGIVTLQFLLTALYFRIKGITLTHLLQQYIGVGDLLFFVALITYFSPLHFIVFFNISILISLVVYQMYLYISKTKNQLIPLAGLQAAVLFITIFTHDQRYNDQFLLDWIM